MRRSCLPFFIFIAAFFISAPVTQAADSYPTPPTEAELRLLEGTPRDLRLVSGPQIEILRLANELRGNSYEMAERLGLTGDRITMSQKAAELYYDALRTLEFARTLQAAPRPNAITAPPIFPDSAVRIQEYLRIFGASTDPAIRADIARLRLIYDPATSAAFTLAQRRAIEQLILSRDPSTLLLEERALIAADMGRRYGTNVTTNALSTALSEFNSRLRNPELLAHRNLTPEQLAAIEAARLPASKAPAIGARTLTPEEQAYRAQLAAALPHMNLPVRERAVLEYYWGLGPDGIPRTQTAISNMTIDGAAIRRMTVNAIVNRPLNLPPLPTPGLITSPGAGFIPTVVRPPTPAALPAPIVPPRPPGS